MAEQGRSTEATDELERLLAEAFDVRRRSFAPRVAFSAPSFKHYRSGELQFSPEPRFGAISVTAGECELQCEHCRGALLGAMVPAESPEALVAQGRRLAKSGGRGVLVSGGCDARGRVPLDPFLGALRELREELGLAVAVHTGLIDRAGARALAEAGVERVMLDLVGDRETAREVLHLDAGPERFEAALEAIVDAGLAAVPHVVAGLSYGRMRGEERAVAMAVRHAIESLVVVVLRPEPGTGMAGCEPVDAEAVGALVARARIELPHRPVLLGCARPVGPLGRRIETLALEAGVNGIAFPADETVRRVLELDLEPHVVDACCSLGEHSRL